MSEVVFLLGAGASHDAGLPLMADLTQSFWEKLEPNTDEAELFSAALDAVGSSLNIEYVLSFLETLADMKEGKLGKAVHGWKSPFGADAAAHQLRRLADSIREHIRSELRDADPRRASYLSGLLDFATGDEPIDIFSLNYDPLVEAVCARNRVRFTTGFSDVWDPQSFKRPGWRVRVFKLHGSVDWYRLPARGVVFRYHGSDPKHHAFPGEEAAEAVLYPAAVKAPYEEPFTTLLGYFTESLQTARFCVSIGYSFGDRHIRQLVVDRLATNARLQLIIVDPRAGEILERQPEDAPELSFRNFWQQVSPLWAKARPALQDRQVRLRIDEVRHVERRREEAIQRRGMRQFPQAARTVLEAYHEAHMKDLPAKALQLRNVVTSGHLLDVFREELDRRIQRSSDNAFLLNAALWDLATTVKADASAETAEGKLRSWLEPFSHGISLRTPNGQLLAWRWRAISGRPNLKEILAERASKIQEVARDYARRPPPTIYLEDGKNRSRVSDLIRQLETLAHLYKALEQSAPRLQRVPVGIQLLNPSLNVDRVREALSLLSNSSLHQYWWPDATVLETVQALPFLRRAAD